MVQFCLQIIHFFFYTTNKHHDARQTPALILGYYKKLEAQSPERVRIEQNRCQSYFIPCRLGAQSTINDDIVSWKAGDILSKIQNEC